jgi:signal peptidase I
MDRLQTLWQNNKSLLLFLLLMMVFRSAVADWNDVPSGSMEPTIIVGDRVVINKMAYDLRIPFTTVSLQHLADPVRGDIIVFESAAATKRLIKRVIGVPGDRIAMVNNRLIVNGEPLAYSATAEANIFMETLADQQYRVKLEHSSPAQGNFRTVTVPEGHYLALGDNRANSADSRVIGFVPRAEIIGRSRQVALSLDYDHYYLPRTERFLQPL